MVAHALPYEILVVIGMAFMDILFLTLNQEYCTVDAAISTSSESVTISVVSAPDGVIVCSGCSHWHVGAVQFKVQFGDDPSNILIQRHVYTVPMRYRVPT
jgi:hypothetical protein